MQGEWYYISTTIQVLDKTSLLQDGTDVSSAEKDHGEREGAVLVQKLPNQLLGQEEEEGEKIGDGGKRVEKRRWREGERGEEK